MNAHGQLTWEATKYIRAKLSKRLFDVYYHHGEESAFRGLIVSSIEKDYRKKEELAHLDIAIVKKATGELVVLIEIEDTADKPKTLLSDLFGTLMGNFISLPGKPKATVGTHTTLIVAAKGKDHDVRNEHLCEKVKLAKPHLGTGNSAIGNIVIQPFTIIEELKKTLMKHIKSAIRSDI